jgi:hypothetical protein
MPLAMPRFQSVGAGPPPPAEVRSPLRHVFVVGAGFSKAINETMPSLIQLGTKIAADLTVRPSFRLLPPAAQRALEEGSIPGGDLESWLSNLANPAPYLSEAEAHFNAGVFSEIATVIGREIDASEHETLRSEAAPGWLHRLIHICNTVGATIVSFNYDTLIEHAAFQVGPTENRWPNVAFTLLKVHGSTNWWRTPGEVGSEIERHPLLPGWGFADSGHETSGGERILVPPVAVKGSYYEPGLIRREWQQARLALEGATKLFLAGYRLPANDLATTALISQHLKSDTEVVLVNLDPSEPDAVLKKIWRPASRNIAGRDSIPTMVAVYDQEVSLELVPTFVAMLETVDGSLPVVARVVEANQAEHVSVGKDLYAIVGIEDEGDRIALVATDAPLQWEDEGTVHASRLRSALAEEPKRIVIRFAGVDHAVLALTFLEAWPHGDLAVRWVVAET